MSDVLAVPSIRFQEAAPYPAAATTSLQHELTDGDLTAGAVAWHGISSGAVPLGTTLGGPLVALLGPRSTLAASEIATVLVAAVFTAFIGRRGSRVVDEGS